MEVKEEMGERIDVEIIELSVRLDYGNYKEKKRIVLLQVIAPIDCNVHIGKAMLWQRKEVEEE